MSLGAARVIYSISDLSLYVDQLTRGYVIAVIQAERGPLWDPVPVASVDEYERIFGRTFLGSTDPLVIKMGLMQGAKFLIIRVVNCTDPADPSTMTAVASSVTLQDRGNVAVPAQVTSSSAGPYTITAPAAGTVTGTEVEGFSFVLDTTDKLKVKVGAGGSQTVTLSGTNITAAQVASLINAGSTDLTASAVSGRVKITADDVADAIEIESVANNCYAVLGLGTGVNAAYAGTDTLTVAIHGQASQNFTLDSGVMTAGQLVIALEDILGATMLLVDGKPTIRTTETGALATVQVSGTARTAVGFDANLHSGSTGTPQDTLEFTAADPGEWGDDLKVHIYDNRLDPDSSFDVRITYANQPSLNEFWDRVNMTSSSDRYVVNFINSRSRLVQVTDLASVNAAPISRPAVNSTGTPLTGGDDGLAGFTDQDWIGDELAQTGFYAADKTDMSIDIMIPGSSSVTVFQSLVTYAEDRGLVAYMQVPTGTDPDDALAWRNGEDPYTYAKWNNMHLMLEFGRPTSYDARYDVSREIPNLGHFAACLGKNDVFYGYASAPVGPRRGTVTMVENIDVNMYDFKGYQDSFANNQINYLQITKEEGAVFWEQYTTLIANSSMQQLNVVRFLLYMKRVFMPVLRTFLFEPNHPRTWGMVHRVLEPQLELWKQDGQIYSYVLQTDRDATMDDDGTLKGAVLNTGLEIQQGIYNARILIQPTLAIRYFQFTVGVLATGTPYVNFEEMHTLPGWVRR